MPTGLIRAIMGHLLAAKAEIDEVIFDKKMREVVLDDNAKIPEDIKVFYWIYPYPNIMLIRDICMPVVRGKFNKMGFFNILKYFPIAYILTDLDNYEGLDELTIHRNLRPDETASIKINLKNVKHHEWPENVNTISGGKSFHSSIHAVPKRKKV